MTFFNTALSDQILDYPTLINYLVPKNINPQQVRTRLAQIKLPGLPWFSSLDDRVISIGSVLASTRKNPLDLLSYFKAQTHYHNSENLLAVLLYTSQIPFPLIIQGTSPLFISMIPGNAIHHFKKVTLSPEALRNFSSLFYSLFYNNCIANNVEKVLMFDEISIKNIDSTESLFARFIVFAYTNSSTQFYAINENKLCITLHNGVTRFCSNTDKQKHAAYIKMKKNLTSYNHLSFTSKDITPDQVTTMESSLTNRDPFKPFKKALLAQDFFTAAELYDQLRKLHAFVEIQNITLPNPQEELPTENNINLIEYLNHFVQKHTESPKRARKEFGFEQENKEHLEQLLEKYNQDLQEDLKKFYQSILDEYANI